MGVFENARADACAQLASSALRSCFRLKAAAPEVRLLLELCDDRGDADDGPKAAKKAFHARCAYLANGAGARSLRKERWRARAVATARGATLHDYAVRDESGLLKPACSPPSPEFRDVASFTSFLGERCTVHAAPLRRVLGTWS